MTTARFIVAARLELLQQINYYEGGSPGLGVRFRLAVEAAVDGVKAYPEAGSPAQRNMRRIFVKGFPFFIVYRLEADVIVIFAVAHNARRPGYWASRIKDQDP